MTPSSVKASLSLKMLRASSGALRRILKVEGFCLRTRWGPLYKSSRELCLNHLHECRQIYRKLELGTSGRSQKSTGIIQFLSSWSVRWRPDSQNQQETAGSNLRKGGVALEPLLLLYHTSFLLRPTSLIRSFFARAERFILLPMSSAADKHVIEN